MTDKPRLKKRSRGAAKAVQPAPVRQDTDVGLPHPVSDTDRPATPELEGGIPLPEELTGRASGTDEDLTALFNNESEAHLADGFRGGSEDEPVADSQADGSAEAERELE
jgi:hypothetical protein